MYDQIVGCGWLTLLLSLMMISVFSIKFFKDNNTPADGHEKIKFVPISILCLLVATGLTFSMYFPPVIDTFYFFINK